MTDRDLPASEAVPATATGNDAAAVTPLGPGFRFHPTNEELISYYLTRKVKNQSNFDAIAEVDVYKHEPSELPEQSRLKTKDQEWFFFSAVDKKYSKGTRTNRATKEGYWKQSGKERKIRSGGQLIGVFKILVFHSGRYPNGLRTNWVIHEYSLLENKQALETDGYVLCRLFRKENDLGPGGCIYAPFSEQDWDDDVDGGRAPVPSVVHAKFSPLCVKEAPFPPIKYKRKRQIDSIGSYNSSSQTTHQDHCFSQETTSDTISSVIATLVVSEPEPVAASSSTELINELQKEKQQIAVVGETYKLQMTNAKVTISFLQGQLNKLLAENEELKKKNSNK